MQDWLILLSVHYPYAVYGLIVIFACLEGPILSILFGVLLQMGFFALLPVYAALMLGDLLGDVIWYWIGYRFGHAFIQKHGRHFNVTEEKVEKVTDIFHRHNVSILLVSKISNGFGFAVVTLMTAGMTRIPFRKFMGLNMIGQFVWSGLLLSVGYFFSGFYGTIAKALGDLSAAGVVLVAGLAVFFAYKVIREKINSRINDIPDKAGSR